MFRKNFNFKINTYLLGALALIILFSAVAGFIALNKTKRILNQRTNAAQEAARPANISLTLIKATKCTDCFSLTPMIKAISKERVKIEATKTIDWTSPAARALITKYKITKVPSLIIKGELIKNKSLSTLLAKLGDIKDQIFVLRDSGAPYVLVKSGEVKGRVKVIMLEDKTCSTCYPVKSHLAILARFGLPTSQQSLIAVNSLAGKKLIKQYKIKLVPTIILSGDLEAYPGLKQIWPQVGTVEKDGAYVFRQGVKSMGTYKDLATNKTIKPSPKTK